MRLVKFILTVLSLAALYLLGAVQVIWSNLRAELVAVEYLTK
jgi:hypothetical protein